MDLPAHAIVLSIDEKSQIQALDRTQPGLPLKPGKCGTMIYDYCPPGMRARSGSAAPSIKRHGTTTQFAALIHKLSGKVAYAVMSFGGFLGMGEKYHALPWGVLTYDTNMGGYVVDIDKSRLEGAPVLAADETSRLEDEAYGRQLHDYYGTRPYWGE
jgi:hypothetical protein